MVVTTMLFLTAIQSEAQPAQVVVTPASHELAVEATVQLGARALDDTGAPMTGVALRWFSSDAAVATVDDAGLVTAVAAGQVRIVAAIGTRGGSATITVRALPPSTVDLAAPTTSIRVGTSVPLTAVALDRAGTPLPEVGIRYVSSNTAVATVDPSGRVFGRGPGSVSIDARAGDAAARLDIQVTSAPPGAYAIVPDGATMRTGDVVRFSVRDGGTAASVYPAWTVSGGGGQIDSEGQEGVFVAERPGRYRVTAVIGEQQAVSAIVDVTERRIPARLEQVGRGPISTHHSGDVWVFEGVDGRDYAYIGTFMHDWAKVWDVTDPAAPFLTDSFQLDARRINDVKIHPNNRVGIVTREGASNRRNGIVVLDLSTPAHPTVFSEYTESLTGGVHNVWIEPNDLVYAVHNGTSDMRIIDISDPRAPEEVGRWGLNKPGQSLHDIIVQEGYAYLSYWDDGLIMLDVGAGTHGGTPTTPVFVSQYKYPVGNTHTAWRHGRYLFVGDEIFPPGWDADKPIETRGYIHVLDMSDVEQPVEVARYEVPEAGAHNVWAEGDRLYVGYYQSGLRVVDISGELRGDLYRQGREIAALKTTDANTTVPNWPMTWGAQIFKGNIFTSDLNSGLWIAKLVEQVIVP